MSGLTLFCFCDFGRERKTHEPESLILAQNERWRQA